MSEENIVHYTRDNLPEGQTDWARVDTLSDEEIEAAMADDPDAAPPLDEEFFRNAELVMPSSSPRVPISIRLDPEVLEFFKRQGPGYQGRINAVLRAYVRSHRR